jgi:hypothetical protein
MDASHASRETGNQYIGKPLSRFGPRNQRGQGRIFLPPLLIPLLGFGTQNPGRQVEDGPQQVK